ncbi:hypothetical protein BLX24_24350 [Arsenicibacter rosenii]|uniref:PNPLA domain-containing protein n=1 Tax=Arsenicibacter rosenii TaxID=1750698 RepID=A0A1S2VCY1_9BACT|nr:hypothetical protein BLX24_24350 [Arsenicibacter rosenii]
MRRSIISVQYFIIYAWAVLRHLLTHLILLLLAYALLSGGPQVQDVFRSINASEPNLLTNIPFLTMTCFTVAWGVSLWYCGRLLLSLADVRGPKLLDTFHRFPRHESRRERERLSDFIAQIPPILGLLPPLLVSLAFADTDNRHIFYVAWFYGLTIGLGLWFTYHRQLLRKVLPGIRFDPFLFKPDRRHWRDIWRLSDSYSRVCYALLIINFAIWLLLIFFPDRWPVIWQAGPVGILLIAFTWLTPLVSYLTYLNRPTRPVLLLLTLWIVICSYFNDHTLLRFTEANPIKQSVRQSAMVLPVSHVKGQPLAGITDAHSGAEAGLMRPGIHKHLRQWVSHRAAWPTDTMPVFIIATEGGGIRSLNWTTGVIQQLDSLIPGFYKQIFAFSGVSGGGVGATFLTTFRRDVPRVTPVRYRQFRQATNDDFLSPVMGALLFHETLQKVLPFPVRQFNRSNWLEDAWSASYYQHLQLHSLDKPFLSLWSAADSLDHPSLFLNAVITESGQKGILSNLQLDSQYFRDVVDIYGITRRDIPIKTAASLTARFPWLSSGGLITYPDGRPFGHVVDGGYWDNTGLETALSILTAITPDIQQFNQNPGRPFTIQPVVLYLKNTLIDEECDVSDSYFDWLIPIVASMNANQRKSGTVSNLTENLLHNYQPEVPYHIIQLDRKTGVPLPLGWYLSDDARYDLWRKVNAFAHTHTTFTKTVGHFFNN